MSAHRITVLLLNTKWPDDLAHHLGYQSRMPASIEEFNKAKCMYVWDISEHVDLEQNIQEGHDANVLNVKCTLAPSISARRPLIALTATARVHLKPTAHSVCR